ncbi:MAG: hypothetical protein IKW08_09705 [Roseburia sp.]|nr:hypothetical protein [Roseburia sp.]
MEQSQLRNIGYKKNYYGNNNDDNRKQCFNCTYSEGIDGNAEIRRCNKWNMNTEEDDTCNAFAFSTYWAFNLEEKDKERRNRKLETAKKRCTQKSNEGCYIATAVYGGYEQPQVLVLRKFRDEVLKKNFFGRLFIKIYYALSPNVAKKLKNHNQINMKVKYVLDKFVAWLDNND